MPLLGILLEAMRIANLRIHQSYDSFFEIFQSPIVVVLIVISVLSVAAPLVSNWRKGKAEN